MTLPHQLTQAPARAHDCRCNLYRRMAFTRQEAGIMIAIRNAARATRLLALVLFDVVRPSRPEYRLPARWLG